MGSFNCLCPVAQCLCFLASQEPQGKRDAGLRDRMDKCPQGKSLEKKRELQATHREGKKKVGINMQKCLKKANKCKGLPMGF